MINSIVGRSSGMAASHNRRGSQPQMVSRRAASQQQQRTSSARFYRVTDEPSVRTKDGIQSYLAHADLKHPQDQAPVVGIDLFV